MWWLSQWPKTIIVLRHLLDSPVVSGHYVALKWESPPPLPRAQSILKLKNYPFTFTFSCLWTNQTWRLIKYSNLFPHLFIRFRIFIFDLYLLLFVEWRLQSEKKKKKKLELALKYDSVNERDTVHQFSLLFS